MIISLPKSPPYILDNVIVLLVLDKMICLGLEPRLHSYLKLMTLDTYNDEQNPD